MSPNIYTEPKHPKDVPIKVVIPFYNCEKWLERSLRSVAIQSHAMKEVFVIDDASTDGSSEIAQNICRIHGFNYIRNEENLKMPLNLVNTVKIMNANPMDVIFILDGDDYLPHANVLRRVGEIFAVANVWFTFGQYMSDPPDYACAPAQPPSLEAIKNRSYRKDAVSFFNHPLIFRKFIFDQIPEQYLQDKNGKWYQAGYDRAIVYPLMELCSDGDPPHWLFVNEILYVYNSINDLSEFRLDPDWGKMVDDVHEKRPLRPYRPIDAHPVKP